MKRTSGSGTDRWHFEKALHLSGYSRIAGVDEAGRGPLAGPVVAAAVVLPTSWFQQRLSGEWQALTDSKQLSRTQRDAFFERLTHTPEITYGIAEVPADQIDRLNILKATQKAMAQAIVRLAAAPQHVLIDGKPVASIDLPQTAVVRGDAQSYSIAAASVLAKVTRDRIMERYDVDYPDYGFGRHKGYGTNGHRQALERYGPCPIHRKSFAPVREQQAEIF